MEKRGQRLFSRLPTTAKVAFVALLTAAVGISIALMVMMPRVGPQNDVDNPYSSADASPTSTPEHAIESVSPSVAASAAPEVPSTASKVPLEQGRTDRAVTPSVKPDVPTKKRRAIAFEIARMEGKAQAEAESKYPTDSSNGGSVGNQAKNAQYQLKLDQKYKLAIMEKYNISFEEVLAIMNEAAEKGWPSPKPPEIDGLP